MTAMNDKTLVEVTQADREAANEAQRNAIMRVGSMHEAFAIHRIKAAKAERDRLRELPDDALARVNVFRDEIDDSDLRAIATALADALESQP